MDINGCASESCNDWVSLSMEYKSSEQDDNDSIEQEIKRRNLDSSYYDEIYTQRIIDLLKLVTPESKYDIISHNRHLKNNHSTAIAIFKKATKLGNYELAKTLILECPSVKLLLSPEKYAFKMYQRFSDLRLLEFLFDKRNELFKGIRTSPCGPSVLDNSKWLSLSYEVYLTGTVPAQEFFHKVARSIPATTTPKIYDFNTITDTEDIKIAFNIVKIEHNAGRKSPTRLIISIDYCDSDNGGRTSPCRINNRDYRPRNVSSPSIHI
jgi:hypothetical protein